MLRFADILCANDLTVFSFFMFLYSSKLIDLWILRNEHSFCFHYQHIDFILCNSLTVQTGCRYEFCINSICMQV